MEQNDKLSLPGNKLIWQGQNSRFSLWRRSSHREQLFQLKKSKHIIIQSFVRLPKLFFLFIKKEKWNKLNWQGSDGRLCSLLGSNRHREQSSRSKKGKNIILKRFAKRAKLFLYFKNWNVSSHQEDKRYFSDDTNLKKNRYIKWMVKLQNEFIKYLIIGQNDNNTEDCYMEESCRNKKAAKCRDVTEGDRYSKLETQKSVCPKLSSINRPNFRVHLYYQLNVIGRRSKLQSHLNSSPFSSNSIDRRGHKGRTHQEFERSKPIAMNKERIIDNVDGCFDREWSVDPASRFDNEHIFALDT